MIALVDFLVNGAGILLAGVNIVLKLLSIELKGTGEST
jgi:hypothetical protein